MSNEAKDQEKAAATFREVIALFEETGLDYAVGGGLSTEYWISGADNISDIDLMIREQDVPQILQCLAENGYETAEMEHSWLHKAFKDGVTVDLMFELKNGTKFDARFKEHRARGELFGTTAFLIAPEDQVAGLTGTIDRETVGQHWYSIIDIMSNNDLDWEYLVSRAESIPLRMLSIIHFALSEQVPVKKGVIERLTEIAANTEGSPR